MGCFSYKDEQLYIEQLSVSNLAKQYGTPLYVYSQAILAQRWHSFSSVMEELGGEICYSVKANSNLALLHWLVQQGSGFDIVSQGELERVLLAGGLPSKIIFSGVAKSSEAIERALSVEIGCFNVESLSELQRINRIAERLNCKAPIALRINPNIDAKTHPYISTGLKENKFGIDYELAIEAYQLANSLPYIELKGIDCHIGSQLVELSPFLDALDKILLLLDELKREGIVLEHIDLGGGLGVCYLDEHPPTPQEYLNALATKLQASQHHYLKIFIEPGRAIVAECGILVTQVEYLKHQQERHFAIVDAGMNDLLRPSLYDAWMRIEPVLLRAQPRYQYNVVGPVCESGDFLGKSRSLALEESDYLVVYGAGAYGFSMSSQYNSRPRAAEVWVDGAIAQLIRERESFPSLWQGEYLLKMNE